MDAGLSDLYKRMARTMKKLKAIASIKVGSKFDVSNLEAHSDGLLTKLRRTVLKWGSENRSKTITFVNESMMQAVRISKEFAERGGDHEKNVDIIGSQLREAIDGFRNLKVSYYSDTSAHARIEEVISNVRKAIGWD